MSARAGEPLDKTFRPRTDHGLTLPEGMVVYSACYGCVRADIWFDPRKRPIWGRRADEDGPNLIGALDHPVWRISAGCCSVATTEAVAKFRAESLARDSASLIPGPTILQVTVEEIAEGARMLRRFNDETEALRTSYEADQTRVTELAP